MYYVQTTGTRTLKKRRTSPSSCISVPCHEESSAKLDASEPKHCVISHTTRLYLHTRFSCRYKALTASYTYRCRSETANIVLIRRMEYRSWYKSYACSVILCSQIRSNESYEEHSKRIFDHPLLYSSVMNERAKGAHSSILDINLPQSTKLFRSLNILESRMKTTFSNFYLVPLIEK